MYYQIEKLVDVFGWSVRQAKELSVRERRHWFKRAIAKENK